LDDYFLDTEYIIGDSVYGLQNFMVSVYKKPVGSPLHPDNEVFNKKLAKPGVSSQHTIRILKEGSLLKGRLPFLWCIWMQLTDKKLFKTILGYVTVCIVLHNFLIGKREEELDEVCDDLSKINADNKELNSPVANFRYSTTRREQVKNYVLENHYYLCTASVK
jgi:hypothetical protein